MDADGSHKKALTNTGWNEFLFWSADANSIIFMSDRSGVDEVYVMNKDGSNQRRYLPNILAGYDIMSWSPDRKLLLLSSRNSAHLDHIYVLNIEARRSHSLVAGDDEYLHPQWSPDQRRIALTRWHQNQIVGIYLIDTDGSNLRSITGALKFSVTPDYIWSADGRSVMFISQDDRNRSSFVYWVDVNGNVLHRIPADNIDALLW